MTLTDYYQFKKLTKAKSRFDVTSSTGEYDLFESVLINKRAFNVGGHSINLVSRPDTWGGKKTDLALTKGSINITSVKRPDISSRIAYGDIKGTRDACVIIFNLDFKKKGIAAFEIYIARGLKNDVLGLWELTEDGELDFEMKLLRGKAVTKNVTDKEEGREA